MTQTYVDFASAWIGVPAHWRWNRNKDLLAASTEVSIGGSEELLSVSHLTGVTPRSEKNVTMTEAESLEGYRVVAPGDLVINTMWAWMGALSVSQLHGIVSPAYGVYRPKPGVPFDPRFFDYLYRSEPYVVEMTRFSRGIWSSRLRLYPDVFLRLPIPVPPIEDQRAIAKYLDRETANIDTLIAKQERLIATLRERRQAGIDNAFRLGEPSRTAQLRRAIVFLTSGSRGWGDYYSDHGARFVRIGNLPRTSLALRGEVQFVELPDGVIEGSRTRLRDQDMLFSITAYLGSVAVVDEGWIGAYVSQHVALCRLDRSVLDPRCVGYYMLTTEGQHQLKEGAFGGTKVQLALDDIRSLVVPFFPLAQQHRIATHLDEQTAKIDGLITKTERFIELAKERRIALITAAVTGQIDARTSA